MKDVKLPRLIEGPLIRKRVVGGSAAAGNHTILWSNEGEVYSFGEGDATTVSFIHS